MWNNIVLRLVLILFGISTAIATEKPTVIKKLTTINASDIRGSDALPLREPADAANFKGQFPSKVIPFQFESCKMLPLICEPLSTEKMRRALKSLPIININAYLTLPDHFDLNSDEKLILEVMLHTSNGLGPVDYKNVKVKNDAGIAVCIVDYAHPDRMGVKNGFIRNPELFNNKMPAMDAYYVAEALKSVPFLAPGYVLTGYSLGAAAVFEACHRWFRQLVSPYRQPYRLFIATGGLPLCQYSSRSQELSGSDPGTILAMFHGQEEKYFPVKAVEDLAKHSNLKCFLEIIRGAGHYYWADNLYEYTLSPAHRHHFTGTTFTPPRSAVTTHEGEPKITYTNVYDFSQAIFKMDLDNPVQIPEEICRLISYEPADAQQNVEALRLCLQNQADFSHLHKELESAKYDELMNYVQQVYQAKIKVTHIGLQADKIGKEMSASELQSQIPKANLEVKMDPEARAYTLKRQIELIKRFCGQNWENNHYLEAVMLTERRLVRLNGLSANIRIVDLKEYNTRSVVNPLSVHAKLAPRFGIIEDSQGLVPILPVLPTVLSLPQHRKGEKAEHIKTDMAEKDQKLLLNPQPISAPLSPRKNLEDVEETAGIA
jgi:hypothetical protein